PSPVRGCGAHPPLHFFPPRRSSDLSPQGPLERVFASRLRDLGVVAGEQDLRHPHSPELLRPRVIARIQDLALERIAFRRLLGSQDRKSTRLNSSHVKISYAGFCWKK